MNRSQVSLRTVFTVCFGVLVVVASVYAVFQARLAITVTLLAAMVAVALNHGVARLQQWRQPRWLAILIVGLLVLGLGTVIGATIIPSAIAQAQVLAHNVPQLLDNIRHTSTFEMLDKRFGVNDAIEQVGKDAPALIFAAANSLVGLVAAVVAVVLLAVFMLIFGAPLIDRGLDEIQPAQRQLVRDILVTFYRMVGGYIAGILLIAGINTIATATFLAILRMPFFLPLAIVSGLASTVPFVGSLITSITITLLALASLGTWPAVACAVFFIALGQIEGNLLGPLIFRHTVHVNPLVTLLAVLFFGTMGGVIGAFLAIPLVAMAQIVLLEVKLFRRERQADSPTAAAPPT
jgi:predicted PurR-regulated permease PerM